MRLKFERARLVDAPSFDYESFFWRRGWHYVAGIDEAGRGALAGPVAAAAVIFPAQNELARRLTGVRDSKELNSERRAQAAEIIRGTALAWAVGFATVEEIDHRGILPATRLAIIRAIQALAVQADFLLVDYLELPECLQPQLALIKGDARSLSIAAASILAKTGRDTHLIDLDARYPGYGLAQHKGYGTARHRSALQRLGPAPIHRHSFAPVGDFYEQ
jgi:ribonuclease HII